MRAPFLSIIIPAHNEAQRLPQTLRQVFQFLQSQSYTYEVVIVENGSDDETLSIARDFAQAHAGFLVMHEERRGKGRAVRSGVLAAHGEYRFICDADLSMPIEEVQKFLPPQLDHFDIAIGSREALGARRFDEPFYRHWGGRAINFAIRVLILPGLYDTQCGFKCFRAATTLPLFEQQTRMGWSFDFELLYLARRKNLRIREIPVHWYFDAHSKVRALRDALAMLADIFRIHWNALTGRYDLTPASRD